MAEAGGPAMAEVQKPMGVVDRVKGKLREMFTVQGRAEVMAQKQIDAILAQVSEDKREEAMQILESRRGEFVEDKMADAKGSLVRDAVILGAGTAAVVGGVYGLSRIEGVRNVAARVAQQTSNTRLGKGALAMVRKGKDAIGGVVNWILRRKPGTMEPGPKGPADTWLTRKAAEMFKRT